MFFDKLFQSNLPEFAGVGSSLAQLIQYVAKMSSGKLVRVNLYHILCV